MTADWYAGLGRVIVALLIVAGTILYGVALWTLLVRWMGREYSSFAMLLACPGASLMLWGGFRLAFRWDS